MEVGPTRGKRTVVGMVCSEQERDRKVNNPRSNPGNGVLSRLVLCRVRPGLNQDVEPESRSVSRTPLMSRDVKGWPLR